LNTDNGENQGKSLEINPETKKGSSKLVLIALTAVAIVLFHFQFLLFRILIAAFLEIIILKHRIGNFEELMLIIKAQQVTSS
jgi:hypothetical protein